MKQYIPRVMAVAIAIVCFAFTSVNDKKNNFYWFPLDASTGSAQSVSTLVFQSSDPLGCSNFPTHPYCEGAYNSYSGTGPYTAAGTRQITDRKP